MSRSVHKLAAIFRCHLLAGTKNKKNHHDGHAHRNPESDLIGVVGGKVFWSSNLIEIQNH